MREEKGERFVDDGDGWRREVLVVGRGLGGCRNGLTQRASRSARLPAKPKQKPLPPVTK